MAAEPVIRLRTLGVLDVTSEGGELPPETRWRKNSALLVYLARSPGRTRTREHLCGLLWPEKPDSSARHSLNEALRILRRILGEGAIEADARQVTLAEGVVALDTDELESAAARQEWELAISLIGGEFLEGFGLGDASGFEDWLTAERIQWRGRSVHALVAGAEDRLAAGGVTAARELAERALARDPFSDLAAQAAIRALALEGDRGGALALYSAFRERLSNELGTEPAPETETVADRVRRERTWRLPPALAPEGRAAPRLELLGRHAELGRLLAGWRRCQLESRAALLTVEGEPGAGKTRLLEELASRVRLEGGTVAGIRAVPADRGIEWAGIRGLCLGGLRDAPGLASAPGPALATLCAELAEWAEQFGISESGDTVPLPRALSDVLRTTCDEQPILLFVDDAEWLDDASRDAVRLLLRDLESLPLAMAIATSGPAGRDELDTLFEGLGAQVILERVSVPRWTEDACARLVDTTLPEFDAPARDRLTRRILADSAGLPLLAVALARAVRDGLALDEDTLAAGWPDTNRTLEQTLPSDLPDTIRSAIRVGFRRLSKESQSFLAAASVMPEGRIDDAAVGRIIGQTNEERHRALDELEWLGWLQAEPRGYGFVARIVRDVVAEDMLTPGQRLRIENCLTDS